MQTFVNRNILIICLCALCCFAIRAQSDQLYYMHQRAGTEQLLQQYVTDLMAKVGISADTLDLIYVNFIPPMGCPRCEGIINVYNESLIKKESNIFLINVLLYEKEKSLSEYIKNAKF